MIPSQKNSVSKNAAGVVVVDGKEYPMAGSLVATEWEIQTSMKKVAKKIAEDYKHLSHRDTKNDPSGSGIAPIDDENPLIVISILKGSYIFTADMVRYFGDYGLSHVVDFLRVASYRGKTKSSGTVELLSNMIFKNLRGKHVLILEDIIDGGHSLQFAHDLIQREYQPASLRTCVLADKAGARVVPFEADYVCLKVPLKWVIGYGFEVNDRYRNLRHIFTLNSKEETRYPTEL